MRTTLLVCGWCLTVSVSLVAQTSESDSVRVETRELTESGVPLGRAVPVAEGPLIDGVVLGDAAYDDAVIATDFVQSRPFEGQPASERTEVRIV